MRKHIWIINHYAGSMYFDKGWRHYNFAKYLKKAGYEPTIFCSNSKHGPAETWFPDNCLWQEHMAEEIKVPFVFVKARTYTGSGKQRVLNMMDFYRNVKKTARAYTVAYGKPDIIYASSVHPLTLVAGIQLAKHFGVECICEVRDLWPETIVAYSSRFTRNHPLIKLLYQGEKWIYKRTDRLIFTMAGGVDYIRERGWEKAVSLSKVYHINNGVDLPVFDANRERYRVEDSDLSNPKFFKVVYAGSIRRANNLGMILDAAKKISDPRIKFLIWGDGDELSALRRRVEEENIRNVQFKGQVGKEYVPSVISQADAVLLHWEIADIQRFGTSNNKLFEYLAAGKPVFSTVTPAYSIVQDKQCGMEVASPQRIAEGIQVMAALPQIDLDRMGQNARRAAKDYDFQNLTAQLMKVIES